MTMHVPSYDFYRQLGTDFDARRRLNVNYSAPDVSSFLEDFKCLSVDDHVVDGQNGNEVPPFACNFCPIKEYQHVLAVVDEDGCLMLYNSAKSGDRAVMQSWLAHNNAVFDVQWLPGEKKLFTASGDQTIALWDVVEANQIVAFTGHTSSVKSIAIHHENPKIFASGARDGNILLWDVRVATDEGCSAVGMIKSAHRRNMQGKTPNKKRNSRKLIHDNQPMSVTAVVFQDENTLVSSGATDGCINVWDVRKITKPDPNPKQQLSYPGTSIRMPGYSHLLFDSTKTKLFASCTDDSIYQFDLTTCRQNVVCMYKGHLNSTFYVRTAMSPDERYIISGSSDYNAYIWSVGHPLISPVQLRGNLGDVTSVAWCPADISTICTLSDDSTVKFWRLNRREESDLPFVGHAQRAHRDIGTSVAMPSPRERSVSHSQMPAPKPKSQRKIPHFECSNPTIKAWVDNFSKRKSPLKLKSPKKSSFLSPRKIIISPMKQRVPMDCPRSKRKLDLEYTPSKRVCALVTPEKQKIPLSPSNTPTQAPPGRISGRKMDFQSPTCDLPNYVLDRQLRNPIPGAVNKENSPSCRKGSNELLKMVSPKSTSTFKSRPSSPVPGKTSTVSGRGSILFYFSPSDAKKQKN